MKNLRAIVLGSGKIAVDCIHSILRMNCSVTVIEQEAQSLSCVRLISEKHGVPYQRIDRTEELTTYLESCTEETLVVSANNNYLFPRRVLEKNNLRVVNFHNSLLPKYPGRNAPTWVLYDQEVETGITWHKVNEEVDAGDLIIQQKVPIGKETTALELTRKCMEVGSEAFNSILPNLLDGRVEYKKQGLNQRKCFHRADEMPNNGKFDPSWPMGKMSSFLRAVDYGKARIFPYPQIELEGRCFSIIKYLIVEPNSGNSLNVERKTISLELERGPKNEQHRVYFSGD